MPLVDPPDQLEAETFHQVLSGSHEALLVTARGAHGPVQCVVKLAERLGMAPLEYLVEWVSTAVGRPLGVPVPEPYAVKITPEFAGAMSDPAVRGSALQSCGVAFGCRYLPGYAQWTPVAPMHAEMREAASELLAFDALIHNFDRTRANANLLVKRDELLAIDHDLALEFVYPPGRTDPGLNPRLDVVEKHVFSQALKGKLARLENFRAHVRSLSDEWFLDLKRATPAPWCDGQAVGKLDRIVDVLRERRDHLDTWLQQVEAWME